VPMIVQQPDQHFILKDNGKLRLPVPSMFDVSKPSMNITQELALLARSH
jgi:hypothetical protein